MVPMDRPHPWTQYVSMDPDNPWVPCNICRDGKITRSSHPAEMNRFGQMCYRSFRSTRTATVSAPKTSCILYRRSTLPRDRSSKYIEILSNKVEHEGFLRIIPITTLNAPLREIVEVLLSSLQILSFSEFSYIIYTEKILNTKYIQLILYKTSK